jgi:DNA-directed RNA polymerase subunit beta'
MKRYRDIKLFDEDSQDLDVYMQEILEKRRQDAEDADDSEAAVVEYASEYSSGESDN